MEKSNQIKNFLDNKFGKKSENERVYQQDNIESSVYSGKLDIYANILATEHHVQQMVARKQFNKSVYNAYSEYINFLDHFMQVLTDEREIEKIKLQLEKLRVEREKYYEPSLLEECSYDLIKEINDKDFKILNKKINK